MEDTVRNGILYVLALAVLIVCFLYAAKLLFKGAIAGVIAFAVVTFGAWLFFSASIGTAAGFGLGAGVLVALWAGLLDDDG